MPAQVSQASVGEGGAVQVQYLELGQSVQRREVVIMDRPAIEAHAYKHVSRVWPELLSEQGMNGILALLRRRSHWVDFVVMGDEATKPMRQLDHAFLPPGPVGEPGEYAGACGNHEQREPGHSLQRTSRTIDHRGGSLTVSGVCDAPCGEKSRQLFALESRPGTDVGFD
jgi:hypothetical protein